MLMFDIGEKQKCLCGAVFEVALPVRHDQSPRPGRSLSMCVDCGRFMSLEKDGTWRQASEVELLMLPKDDREEILRVREAFKQALPQFPTLDRRERMMKLWAERERIEQAQGVGANLHQPLKVVLHLSLIRFSPESVHKSHCPTCKVGVLLVRRLHPEMKLSRIDNCVHCGQFYWYADTDLYGEPFAEPAEPVPSVKRKEG